MRARSGVCAISGEILVIVQTGRLWFAEELECRGETVGESTPVLRYYANVRGKPLGDLFGVAGRANDNDGSADRMGEREGILDECPVELDDECRSPERAEARFDVTCPRRLGHDRQHSFRLGMRQGLASTLR